MRSRIRSRPVSGFSSAPLFGWSWRRTHGQWPGSPEVSLMATSMRTSAQPPENDKPMLAVMKDGLGKRIRKLIGKPTDAMPPTVIATVFGIISIGIIAMLFYLRHLPN